MRKLLLPLVVGVVAGLAGIDPGQAARSGQPPDSLCGGGGCCNVGSGACATAFNLGTGSLVTSMQSDGAGALWYKWKCDKNSGDVLYEFSNFAAGTNFEIWSGCNGNRLRSLTVPAGQTSVSSGSTVGVGGNFYWIKVTGVGCGECGQLTMTVG